VRGIYLDSYLRWDSKSQHEQMLDIYGYETLDQQRTFDRYMHVDCLHYTGLHDYIKFLKWGYGLASDHASREIRLRRITRAQGIDLVRRYQDVRPRDETIFLDWLGMSSKEFYRLLDQHRDPRIWEQDDVGDWQLKDSVMQHAFDTNADIVAQDVQPGADPEFRLTPTKNPADFEFRHRILARGWVDAYS